MSRGLVERTEQALITGKVPTVMSVTVSEKLMIWGGCIALPD